MGLKSVKGTLCKHGTKDHFSATGDRQCSDALTGSIGDFSSRGKHMFPFWKRVRVFPAWVGTILARIGGNEFSLGSVRGWLCSFYVCPAYTHLHRPAPDARKQAC